MHTNGIFKELSLGARATTSGATLAIPMGVALVDFERQVNTLVYLCMAARTHCLDFACGADLLKQAKIAATLQQAAPATASALRAAPAELAEAPLRHTIAFLTQWVSPVVALADGIAEAVMQAAGRVVAEATSVVDARCPRWGENINDNAMHDQGAKIQLVLNPGLSALPSECRALHGAMSVLNEVADTLRVPIDSRPEVREWIRAARNSFGFGKKTVNAAAATKVLFTSPVRPQSVTSILTLRSTLPLSLVSRLEALLKGPKAALAQSSGVASDSAPASSASSGPRGLKRSKSSASVALTGAPPPKRRA